MVLLLLAAVLLVLAIIIWLTHLVFTVRAMIKQDKVNNAFNHLKQSKRDGTSPNL